MAYAHENVELTPMPGVDAKSLKRIPIAKANEDEDTRVQPRLLTRETQEFLENIGKELKTIEPVAAVTDPQKTARPATSVAAVQ